VVGVAEGGVVVEDSVVTTKVVHPAVFASFPLHLEDASGPTANSSTHLELTIQDPLKIIINSNQE